MGDDVAVRHVFLSYAQVDSAAADVVQAVLEQADVRVWRDTAQIWPGEDWRAKIRQAIIGDALVFIALFSRDSLALEKSQHREEVALAIDELMRRQPAVPWLIPVRANDCEIPDMDIGAGRTLRSLKSADLFGPDRKAQIGRLVESVTRLAGGGQLQRTPGRGWNRNRVLWSALGGAACVLALITGIALATQPKAPPRHHSAAGSRPPVSPQPTIPHHRPTPHATAASPLAPRVVAQFHGTGQENTPRFTVPATWKLVWQYNCASFGDPGVFQVYEDNYGGKVSVNELGKAGHGTTFGYSDAGSHYLQVNSVCGWQLKIVAG
jgi:TIR domain